jgi:hypothetical protein
VTTRRLKCSVFRSIIELQEVIDRFVEETTANPKSFIH